MQAFGLKKMPKRKGTFVTEYALVVKGQFKGATGDKTVVVKIPTMLTTVDKDGNVERVHKDLTDDQRKAKSQLYVVAGNHNPGTDLPYYGADYVPWPILLDMKPEQGVLKSLVKFAEQAIAARNGTGAGTNVVPTDDVDIDLEALGLE